MTRSPVCWGCLVGIEFWDCANMAICNDNALNCAVSSVMASDADGVDEIGGVGGAGRRSIEGPEADVVGFDTETGTEGCRNGMF